MKNKGKTPLETAYNKAASSGMYTDIPVPPLPAVKKGGAKKVSPAVKKGAIVIKPVKGSKTGAQVTLPAAAQKRAAKAVDAAVKKGAVVTKPTEGSRGASVVLPAAAKKAAPTRKRGA